MSVAVIGGINSLKKFYQIRGLEFGYEVKVFNQKVPNIRKRLNGCIGIILFTDTVSHNLVSDVVNVARKQGIPIKRSHSSSISGLKRSLEGLTLACRNS